MVLARRWMHSPATAAGLAAKRSTSCQQQRRAGWRRGAVGHPGAVRGAQLCQAATATSDDHDVPWGHPPIELEIAAPVADLPAPGSCSGSGGCRYEPKWDGWRSMILCGDEQQPQIRSRTGRRLDPYLPDVRGSVAALPPETALDAEAVAWDNSGRTDFAALQRRLVAGRGLPIRTARHPAFLLVFDALIVGGVDLRGRPLIERRAALEQLLADRADRLLLCPQTDDLTEATAMADEMGPLGVEGLVIKPASGRYRGGRHRGGWRKWRARHSTEAVVGGITGRRARPATLILGRYDSDGRLRVVGRTGRLTDAQAAELAPLLHHPGTVRQRPTHPWPLPLPAGWLGHIGQPEALPYRQVEPEVVVEVSADSAYEAGRWRHQTRYLRYRLDLSPWDTPPHRWDTAD